MRNLLTRALPIGAFFLIWAASTPAFAQGGGGAQNPRCENAVNPKGLLTPHPQFSWSLANPNVLQRAYQILVASSEEKLKADEPDMWDSGRADTNKTTARYEGKPLASNQRYYWKIRLWETFYQNGSWSDVQNFEMGVLFFDERKAK